MASSNDKTALDTTEMVLVYKIPPIYVSYLESIFESILRSGKDHLDIEEQHNALLTCITSSHLMSPEDSPQLLNTIKANVLDDVGNSDLDRRYLDELHDDVLESSTSKSKDNVDAIIMLRKMIVSILEDKDDEVMIGRNISNFFFPGGEIMVVHLSDSCSLLNYLD